MTFSTSLKNIIWSRLQTQSRKALLRINKKYGHPYKYTPRSDLVINLSYDLNLAYEVVANELMEMRQEILEHARLNNSI